ncbi:sulfite exporter TauE/SafE family protein [Clostridium chromiireducens]|uniref:Probable membrane transporter protein n=1 Tax=Clostridium chromiireducens TaxID=225345 RepID=A0A399IU35_9CLOT|nr:TSUP family transporter [Clostridium chromiireducens]RII35819.1 sulfite exporter TauE/SafE family protein [Clostridium chromiireducens]
MIQYIIVCPLVFLAGFVDAIAGGGGLISLPAFIFAGIPVHLAIGTNKMSASMGTAISTYRYAKNGYIKLKIAACSVVCALIGSALGATISLKIDDHYFKILMIVILPVIAFYVLRKRDFEENKCEETSINYKTYIICMLSAFFIGIYDGFYGPGTGTFLILLLTGVANLRLNTAAGTTKAINLSSNIAGLITFIINGKVYLILGLVAGLFSIAGNYMGSGYFTKSGAKIARPVIIIVLTVFFIKILFEVL